MDRVPTFVLVCALLFFLSFTRLFASPVAESVPTDSIKLMLKSLGGDLGIKAIGASGALIQLLVRFLKSKQADQFFQRQEPWVRLAIVSGLTFAITPVSLMTLGGLPLAGALLHATSLNAFLVFLDQILQKSGGKK